MSGTKIVYILTGNTTHCVNKWVYTYTTWVQSKGNMIHTNIEYIIDRFRRGIILTHWLTNKEETKAISFPYADKSVIVLPVNACYSVCKKLENNWYEIKKIFLMKDKSEYRDCPNGFEPRINNLLITTKNANIR